MAPKIPYPKFWINVGFRLKDGSVSFPLNGTPLEPRMSSLPPSADQIEGFEHMMELAEKLAPGEDRIVAEGENIVTSIYRINEN